MESLSITGTFCAGAAKVGNSQRHIQASSLVELRTQYIPKRDELDHCNAAEGRGVAPRFDFDLVDLSFAPPGLTPLFSVVPRLALWAAFFCRFAACSSTLQLYPFVTLYEPSQLGGYTFLNRIKVPSAETLCKNFHSRLGLGTAIDLAGRPQDLLIHPGLVDLFVMR